jgi:hypothetical protein
MTWENGTGAGRRGGVAVFLGSGLGPDDGMALALFKNLYQNI